MGSALGSNVLIATTTLSKKLVKEIDVKGFKLDVIFLIVTTVLSVMLFVDGYNYVDGLLFTGFFVGYLILAYWEAQTERRVVEWAVPPPARAVLKAVGLFIVGG